MVSTRSQALREKASRPVSPVGPIGQDKAEKRSESQNVPSTATPVTPKRSTAGRSVNRGGSLQRKGKTDAKTGVEENVTMVEKPEDTHEDQALRQEEKPTGLPRLDEANFKECLPLLAIEALARAEAAKRKTPKPVLIIKRPPQPQSSSSHRRKVYLPEIMMGSRKSSQGLSHMAGGLGLGTK
mmetsp:Transcript_12917/g.26184  ORF Transcript_12917/g.26184 Transcript_12917/m.26184 type:complete len:183 (-) Transcript_12917:4-552(-)